MFIMIRSCDYAWWQSERGSTTVVSCRVYLAKGKLLKDNGRKGDATRMFIQAKYLAPAEARAAVDQIANQ